MGHMSAATYHWLTMIAACAGNSPGDQAFFVWKDLTSAVGDQTAALLQFLFA